MALICFVCYAITAFAQDSKPTPVKDSLAKKSAQGKPDSTYQISFTGSGSINKAVDDITYLFNNDLKFVMEHDSTSSLSFDNNWVYGTDHHMLTNNDYSSILQFDLGRHRHKNRPHFYYWGLASYNTSYSLKVNNQFLAGAGLAFSIFDNTHAKLSLSDGPVYDHSDLILPDSSRLSYNTVRNSFRLAFRFEVKNLLVIDGTDFLQNSFSMGSDYIVRSTTNLSFKLNKWLLLTSSLVYNEQRRTESSNFIFTYGVKIDKYF
jgi:hypothetical protein